MFNQMIKMLRTCDTDQGVLPPTEVYNEGWMLRLTLDWFSRQPASEHQLSFEKGARWYSAISLPSPFLPRYQKDPLSESHPQVDGVIGHFSVGRSGKSDIDLHSDAKQFVVVAAKIFSRLSKGIKNFKNYDQAARTTACIAETLSLGQGQISDISRLGFYVVAAENQLKFEPTFQTFLEKASIRIKVQKRIKAYSDSTDAESKNRWFQTWFLPTLESIDIQCLTWEEIISNIHANDRQNGDALLEFYEKCLALNQSRPKLSPTEKLSAQVATGKIIRIQVKSRNPKYDPNWRWFQIRVQPKELSAAKNSGVDAGQTWIDKVNKVDFFILDTVKHDEMWVLPKEKIFELNKLNEHRYGSRPDNIFKYETPLKQKQKEMNLDVEVAGEKLTEKFAEYLDNFQLIVDALAKGAVD